MFIGVGDGDKVVLGVVSLIGYGGQRLGCLYEAVEAVVGVGCCISSRVSYACPVAFSVVRVFTIRGIGVDDCLETIVAIEGKVQGFLQVLLRIIDAFLIRFPSTSYSYSIIFPRLSVISVTLSAGL